jgi:undecaprenyl-diphosphatase
MTFLHAIILGIVEGITEFLPVSSTAHITLASKLLGLMQTDFLKSFTIIIQFGAILAVCVIFFKVVWEAKKELVPRVLAGFIPTAIIGFVLYKFIKGYLLGNVLISGYTLLLGGIAFLVLEYWYLPKHTKTLDAKYPSIAESTGFGVAQAIAVIPGVSRSGALIVYGLLRGYSREVVTTFAFLLAVPTMFAASAYDLYKSSHVFTTTEWQLLLVGSVVSFIVAYIVSRWFISYISKHSFAVFGWYRVVLGIVVILIFTLAK